MESPPYMRCVMRLDANSPGWHKTMIKVLTSVQGVSYSIDAVQGLAYVEGKIESDVILKIMEKAGQHAQLWRIDSISSRDYHGNDDHDHDHGHANVNDDHTRDQINFNHHHHSTSVHAHEQPPLVPPAADTVSHKKPTNCCTM